MSSETPAATATANDNTPPPATENKNTEPIETAVSVISTDENGTHVIDPIRAKALLGRFTVTHQHDHTYTIAGDANPYTANRAENTCTCPSTLPERGEPCEHLQHLQERDERGELTKPTSGSTLHEQRNHVEMTRESTSNNDSSVTPGTSVECEECSKELGHTKHLRAEIGYATCNVCALENRQIYYLDTTTGTDRELVHFDDILTNTTAASYYHDGATMSVYDFFETHPDTTGEDSVITVSQRLTTPDCAGLIFESDTTAVPGSVLTRAIDTMDTDTTSESQTDSAEDTRFNIIRGFESYSREPLLAANSQTSAAGAPMNK